MTEIIDIVEPAIPGSKGEQGPAGEIVGATATALPTGAEPTVQLGGTPSERTIEFGLPRGPKGDPGDGSLNSVNGDFGPDVVLDAGDVGAIPMPTPTPADGTILKYDSSASAYIPSFAGIGRFNVLDFGAVGDGITDDKIAIQNALDAAFAAGGGEVIVPPLEYLVGSVLIIRENTVFSAYGARFMKGTSPYSWFRNFQQEQDSFPEYSGNSNILIRGGTWYGKSGSHTEASGNCITLAHCENVEVRDVTFIDVTAAAHAVEFNAVRNGRIINCTALGYQEIGGTSNRSEAFQIDLASSATVVCQPADDTVCQNILIDGCVIGESENLGPWGAGIGSHNMVGAKFHEGIIISNNEIRSALQQGIHLWQYRDSVVTGNIIYNCGDIGILLVGSVDSATSSHTGVKIVDNTLVNNNTGIQVSGLGVNNVASNCVVSGNTVIGCTSWGVRVANARNVVVQGNAVRESGSHGVLLADTQFNTVQGNSVDNCGGYGVILSPNAHDCIVTGNIVTRPGGGAYRLSAGSSRNSIIANAARLDGVPPFSGSAISLTAAAENNRRFGNDFYGMGTNSISDSGTSTDTTTADRT